jgi:hypothetical protein
MQLLTIHIANQACGGSRSKADVLTVHRLTQCVWSGSPVQTAGEQGKGGEFEMVWNMVSVCFFIWVHAL